MIAFLVLTATTFSLFGFIIGIWAKGFEQLQFIPMLVVTPLTFLGGAFYSIDMLPPAWRTVTPVQSGRLSDQRLPLELLRHVGRERGREPGDDAGVLRDLPGGGGMDVQDRIPAEELTELKRTSSLSSDIVRQKIAASLNRGKSQSPTTADHRTRVATLSQKSVNAHAFAKRFALAQDPAIDGKCLASDTTRYLIGGNHETIFGGFSRNLLSRSIRSSRRARQRIQRTRSKNQPVQAMARFSRLSRFPILDASRWKPRPHRLYLGEGFYRADFKSQERFVDTFSNYLAGHPEKFMLIDLFDAASNKPVGEYGFGGFKLYTKPLQTAERP